MLCERKTQKSFCLHFAEISPKINNNKRRQKLASRNLFSVRFSRDSKNLPSLRFAVSLYFAFAGDKQFSKAAMRKLRNAIAEESTCNLQVSEKSETINVTNNSQTAFEFRACKGFAVCVSKFQKIFWFSAESRAKMARKLSENCSKMGRHATERRCFSNSMRIARKANIYLREICAIIRRTLFSRQTQTATIKANLFAGISNSVNFTTIYEHNKKANSILAQTNCDFECNEQKSSN